MFVPGCSRLALSKYTQFRGQLVIEGNPTNDIQAVVIGVDRSRINILESAALLERVAKSVNLRLDPASPRSSEYFSLGPGS